MKKIRNFWNKMPLNKKFATLIVLVLAIPIIAISVLYFNNLKQVEKEELIKNAQSDLNTIELFASTNGDMASAIVQLVHSNPQLIQALSNNLSTSEIISFNNEVTPYLENITITNPYISSLRVYVNSEIMPERYPIYIDKERVSSEEWFINAQEDVLNTRIGYSESLSEHIVQLTNNSMISFYQALISNDDEKSIIEVAFEMTDFFGTVFSETENGICLIVSGDDVFMNDFDGMSDESKQILISLVKSLENEVFTDTLKTVDGVQYLVSYKYSKKLKLSYYIVNDYSLAIAKISNNQIIAVVLLGFLFLILGYIFEKLSKILLKRIYTTISAMRQLETGDVLVKIENPSLDEVGQLQKYFNKMVVKIDDLIEQTAKRAILEKNAEIKALQNQINSHFLYNVLNNIEMMAIVDENFLIADTVTALARLLRYSMNWSRQMVLLSSELAYVKEYIQLFNIRFDNSIILICDVSEEAQNAYIPKMSVQPIVENAIKHGIENLTSDEMIKICASIEDKALVISVTDTGSGMSEEVLEKLRLSLRNTNKKTNITGIGLNNVCERIEKRFGKGYGIEIESKISQYTKVTLTIPHTSQAEIAE